MGPQSYAVSRALLHKQINKTMQVQNQVESFRDLCKYLSLKIKLHLVHVLSVSDMLAFLLLV